MRGECDQILACASFLNCDGLDQVDLFLQAGEEWMVYSLLGGEGVLKVKRTFVRTTQKGQFKMPKYSSELLL